jgi:predicted outer membrane repeat protein
MVTVEGMLPENVLLVASEPAGYEPELQDGETLLFAVDITLYGEGEVYQPESPIAVSLTLPEELLEDLPADGEITVYHDHADETTRLADVQPDDAGTVAFETDGFSVFYGTATVQADEEKTLPNGGTLSSGTYILSSDTTLTKPLTIASGANVTIDLNGYTLTGSYSWIGKYSMISVNDGATLTIKNGTVTGQSIWQEGGAINNAGNLNVENVKFSQCTAIGNGGAIYSTGVLNISGSTFENCSAAEGGAISASGTITIENTSFATCKSTGRLLRTDGGGACEFSASSGGTNVEMNGVTFTECTAANNNGNAISMGSGTTLNTQNVSVTGCGSTDTAIHGSISGQVTVRPTVEPTFTITIPETLPVGNTAGMQISAQLTDFSDTQYVSVTVKSSGGFSLAQEGSNASLAYTLFSGSQAITNGGTVATFKATDQGAQTLTAKLNDASDVKYAGTYTDTLTFTVTLHDE